MYDPPGHKTQTPCDYSSNTKCKNWMSNNLIIINNKVIIAIRQTPLRCQRSGQTDVLPHRRGETGSNRGHEPSTMCCRGVQSEKSKRNVFVYLLFSPILGIVTEKKYNMKANVTQTKQKLLYRTI